MKEQCVIFHTTVDLDTVINEQKKKKGIFQNLMLIEMNEA